MKLRLLPPAISLTLRADHSALGAHQTIPPTVVIPANAGTYCSKCADGAVYPVWHRRWVGTGGAEAKP